MQCPGAECSSLLLLQIRIHEDIHVISLSRSFLCSSIRFYAKVFKEFLRLSNISIL